MRRKTTPSVQTSAGFLQNIVRVEGSTAWLICPICREEFQRQYGKAADQLRNQRIQYCTRSCRTKGTFAERPSLRQQAANTMRKLRREDGASWNKGLPWSDERRAAMSAQARGQGRKIKKQGGNGRGMSPTEALIAPLLPPGFSWNWIVPLGPAEQGYPSHYKLDFGNPTTKVCLEVDGNSHRTALGKTRDAKKTAKLQSLGWTVYRVKNTDAWSWFTTSELKTRLLILLVGF